MAIGVYFGSFDPVTHGHLFVIERASQLVTTLWVRVGNSPIKQHLFSLRERVAMLRHATRHLPNVRCTTASAISPDEDTGLLFVVRGVRNRRDYAEGAHYGQMMVTADPGCVLLFIQCPPSMRQLSSSALKRRVADGRDAGKFAPPFVVERVRKKLKHARRGERQPPLMATRVRAAPLKAYARHHW